ncbi:hypothetical protein MBLNU459_g6544t1 [Dothideomycetes sp. NU459]
MLPPQLGQAQRLRPSSLHPHPNRALASAARCRSASHLSKRFGKHWGPPRRNKAEHERESAPSPDDAKRKRLDEIRDMKARIRAHPYNALFGHRFEPFWTKFMPDCSKQEMAYQMPIETEVPKPGAQSGANAGASVFAQSSSFHMCATHQAGSEPTINATSSSWDSKSNQTKRSVYDPISGRMLPVGQTPAMSASVSSASPVDSTAQAQAAANPSSGNPDQKPVTVAEQPDNELDSLTADKVRASVGKSRATTQQAAVLAKQYASLKEDYDNRSFNSEHEELLEARKTLATLRAQIQILERNAHSTLTKPDDDAVRPAFYEDGWDEAPTGLQTAYNAEKDACDHGEKKSLEHEMSHLGEAEADIDDGYSRDPKGMQTLFLQEQDDVENGLHKSLEEEVRVLGTEEGNPKYDDGYSTDPIGLQTGFEDERADVSKESLEHELNRLGKDTEHVNPEDYYSKEPIGMQTAYKNEDVSRLEQELNEKLKAKEYDDGYSTAPTGMQTIFSREEEESQRGGRETLEQEISKKHVREVYDDGYSTAPTGLETAFQAEDNESLEREMLKKHHREVYDDGYSTKPVGLETAFKSEDSKALEQEMLKKHEREVYDDGYSNAPTGLETAFKSEGSETLEREMLKKHDREVYDDGYSNAPTGMETAFKSEDSQRLEQEMLKKHEREVYDDGYPSGPTGLETAFKKEQIDGQSLEQDIKTGLRDTPVDDGYATTPIGLQTMFRLEEQDVQNAKRQSLEDEIQSVRTQEANSHFDAEIQRQKNLMQDHEDGYSRKPTGMQTSFEQDKSLEADMKAMQGEGDVCTNVGKFANSSMWYKQPAPSNLSEDVQKAEQKKRDNTLVQQVRNAYEEHYGAINTEHRQPQTMAESESKTEDGAHKILNEQNKVKEHGQGGFEGSTASKTTSITSSESAKTASKNNENNENNTAIKWAEPALYKVVTYDPSKDTTTITTTPSKFSNTEFPLAIAKALSRLHQPARFVPYFAALQKDGYHVVQAGKNLLVLRKVEDSNSKTAESPVINPVDPVTSRPIHHVEVPVGRFASPTGFVNYDPIFDSPSSSRSSSSPLSSIESLGDKVEEYRHHPSHMMRREEVVFSGSRRWKKHARDGGIRKERHGRRWRKRVVWVLSVGAGTAACMYVVGVATELARKEDGASKHA